MSNLLFLSLFLPFLSAGCSSVFSVDEAERDYLSCWTADKGRRFEIVQGYMKDVIVDMMYDDTVPIPGGIFAVSFSFDCVDFEGKELGCGLYCDNQWGGNKDEQYYFIPLKYEVIGKNHFRLFLDRTRKTITNKNASLAWVERSEDMSKLLKELCNSKGWYIGCMPDGYMGTLRWIFKRADAPEKKQLYYNSIKRWSHTF